MLAKVDLKMVTLRKVNLLSRFICAKMLKKRDKSCPECSQPSYLSGCANLFQIQNKIKPYIFNYISLKV